MEEELKCPVCRHFFSNPILMPCYHTICLNCAINSHQPVSLTSPSSNSNGNLISPVAVPHTASNNNLNNNIMHNHNHNPHLITTSATVHQVDEPAPPSLSSTGELMSTTSSSASSDMSEPDKLSLLSETDSGVICTSRPNSYVGTPSIQGFIFPSLPTISVVSLSCPVCHKMVYLDENGAHNLPRNRTLQNIVDRYEESKQLATMCQLCEGDPKEATVMCEQCEVFYCERCRDHCHPMRGPLAKHQLISTNQGKLNLRLKTRGRDLVPKCLDHQEASLTSFCMVCKTPVCSVCLHEARHAGHDVQSLATMCKSQKTELSQNLQALSEKAKNATEFIQRLKSMTEKVNENVSRFEAEISSQCDMLIAAIETRKQQLVSFARKERDYKQRVLKDQVTSCTTKLQQTTGLIQFCIEALKETDPTAYLQIGYSLINRVSNIEMTWHKDISASPWISTEFDLTLDTQSVLHAIEQLTFAQMKPPAPPILIPEECLAENNSITVAWQPHPSSFVEGFILELDDGNGGSFREVYCGKESICTIDGLHFNSLYHLRVKAYNSTGDGPYGDVISLQTADVAWFSLDPIASHPDMIISNENMTVTCDNYEHRLAMANMGFSRGIHYWEVNIERYQNNADIAFGVATCGVTKDKMLGKDEFGWSMYIDNKRSWFLHADQHKQRTDGGVDVASVVGVLLDLDSRQLQFFVNDERQGFLSLGEVKAVFYPCFSLNRNVQLSVTSGLDPPASSGVNSAADSELSDGETKLRA